MAGGSSISRNRRLLATVLLVAGASIAVVSGATGCARSAGPIFDPADAAHRWPPPPDEPRIRYVGELRGDADLKPPRGPARSLGAFLFGKEPVHVMLSPMGVCTDNGSRVFVVDSNAQVVHVFDLDSRKYDQWKPPADRAPFSQPVAAAFDPEGRLLVSDSVAGWIVVFDARGEYLGTMGEGNLRRPCGLAVDDARSRIFVADPAAHQVVVLSREGVEVARIGDRGTAPGQFNFPTYVCLDRAGDLFVSDSLNFRVQMFDAALTPLRQIGRKGDMPGYFSQPKGVAVDGAGRLYIVDANFEAVQLFDTEGNLLMTFGREGRGAGEFWLPCGISIDPQGRAWIADSYNRRVQVFEIIPEGGSP